MQLLHEGLCFSAVYFIGIHDICTCTCRCMGCDVKYGSCKLHKKKNTGSSKAPSGKTTVYAFTCNFLVA